MANLKKLTAKEIKALELSFSGMSDVQAYQLTHPNATSVSCNSNASHYFKRIRQKLTAIDELKYRNLSYSRVFEELEKRLNAMTTEFYQGKAVAECEDNTTRMRATELLAKINGLLNNPIQTTESETSESSFTFNIVDTPPEAE